MTTWWFVTPRRPGIDLALVENRTPLSVDALRAALGAHAVFAHDQRAGYRSMVRDTLFGGADIDQHIRLLHILRSPRVGDRIDVDVPHYLDDALPQLSEAALDDAAQPLEDLEEHRRNVEDLTRTCATLQALEAVYRNYGRAELHRRAGHVVELADAYTARRRDEEAQAKDHAGAMTARDEADAAVVRLVADNRRLKEEIESLKDSDDYRQGAELNELRRRVDSLQAQVDAAEAEVTKHGGRLDEARTAIGRARSQAEGDLASLQQHLSDLAGLAVAAGLPRRPPAPLRVETAPSPVAAVEVPVAPADVEPARAGMGHVRADLTRRMGDVEAVREALAAVDTAEMALRVAESAVQTAESDEQDALAAYATSRHALTAAVDRWRGELGTWVEALDAHRLAEGLAVTAPELLGRDLAAARDEVVDLLRELLEDTTSHHRAIAATLVARRADEQGTVEELRQRLDELRARTLPDPPAAHWQRPERAPCLAELVDFDPSLDPTSCAGIEAALEAAGLLGAEIVPDGGLVLADGQLVAAPGRTVDHPLSRHLRAVMPDELDDTVLSTQVAAVLDAISTDPDDLTGDAGRPVVTLDGRFRAGTLLGRHAKARAEHVGLGARRAALERQREAAAAELAAAQAVVERTDLELTMRAQRLEEVRMLRRDLPPLRPVADAVAHAERAELALAHSRVVLRRRLEERFEADRSHGEAVDVSRRAAADHGLPADRPGLDQVADSIRAAQPVCGDVNAGFTALVRSVADWSGKGEACDRAAEDVRTSAGKLAGLRAEHEPAAARLATLDDAVGLPYREIQAAIATCEGELATAEDALGKAREAQLAAHGEVTALAEKMTSAAEARRLADGACVAALPTLQGALSVPGLVASALSAGAPTPAVDTDTDSGGEPGGTTPATAPALPVVPETADGARQLADRVVALVPPPADPAAGGESVRLSLRQRRDALGAGWDAEDRQPDETLPLHVEVTGPLGRMPLHESAERAEAQRRSMAGLLSAKQDQALRNLLQGLIAREVAAKLHAARELVKLMNDRLDAVTTSHGIGVSLRWQRRDDLDAGLADTIGLLAKTPDLRTPDEEQRLARAVAARIAEARAEDSEASYRDLIARVLDYRGWHRMVLLLHRPGRNDERLNRRTALSEGEKKMVSYLPLFAAVAASCDALAEHEPAAPRFVLLDDAFAKVSEDNHAKLFGLLVEMDLDFVATSERLWGTHDTVPELAITEVLRDADLGVIVLEHSRWDGRERVLAS